MRLASTVLSDPYSVLIRALFLLTYVDVHDVSCYCAQYARLDNLVAVACAV